MPPPSPDSQKQNRGTKTIQTGDKKENPKKIESSLISVCGSTYKKL